MAEDQKLHSKARQQSSSNTVSSMAKASSLSAPSRCPL